jgi:hypothetical protein
LDGGGGGKERRFGSARARAGASRKQASKNKGDWVERSASLDPVRDSFSERGEMGGGGRRFVAGVDDEIEIEMGPKRQGRTMPGIFLRTSLIKSTRLTASGRPNISSISRSFEVDLPEHARPPERSSSADVSL